MADCNGFTNYETWNICLWVDNEEWAYRAKVQKLRFRPFTAESVEQFCRDQFPNGTPDMEGKLVDMAKCDWEEVADHFNAD